MPRLVGVERAEEPETQDVKIRCRHFHVSTLQQLVFHIVTGILLIQFHQLTFDFVR